MSASVCVSRTFRSINCSQSELQRRKRCESGLYTAANGSRRKTEPNTNNKIGGQNFLCAKNDIQQGKKFFFFCIVVVVFHLICLYCFAAAAVAAVQDNNDGDVMITYIGFG